MKQKSVPETQGSSVASPPMVETSSSPLSRMSYWTPQFFSGMQGSRSGLEGGVGGVEREHLF